ncbi:hypothetical protein TIFTF001_008726 [Ficus carica]|uniref:Uncharacterized protein n=1 Tax=Ficus carica TaxID=3494 RepID=A0AA87ZTZ7_FICCA|nr:hypothetical protein TIFTF001_008726 [Ficus carica]
MREDDLGLPASVACGGVRCGLQHRACAVKGVGRGYFEAEHGEFVVVRCPQIQVYPSQGLVNTIRVGLCGGGEGVGSVRGPALPIVGGVHPLRAADFSSLLLAFFPRWSYRTDGCFGVDGCGYAGGGSCVRVTSCRSFPP